MCLDKFLDGCHLVRAIAGPVADQCNSYIISAEPVFAQHFFAVLTMGLNTPLMLDSLSESSQELLHTNTSLTR